MRLISAVTSLAILLCGTSVHAEDIGHVDTTFRLLGKNDRIIVEVFDDPMVAGVSCYLSRANTGGIGGSIGIAQDKSDSSVACRQVGLEISFKGPIGLKEEVFSEKASILFKHVRVVRMVDPKRQVLVYLVYSDRLIDGSPKNSVTAVPVSSKTPIPLK